MKYKFWEVIKMLTENNNLQFKTKHFTIKLIGNRLVFIGIDGSEFEGIDADDFCEDYEIIEQPVHYIEALKALEQGKTIKICKADNRTKEVRNFTVTSDMNNFEFCLDDIKHGEWYIL
jgi:hypothetical protein